MLGKGAPDVISMSLQESNALQHFWKIPVVQMMPFKFAHKTERNICYLKMSILQVYTDGTWWPMQLLWIYNVSPLTFCMQVLLNTDGEHSNSITHGNIQ